MPEAVAAAEPTAPVAPVSSLTPAVQATVVSDDFAAFQAAKRADAAPTKSLTPPAASSPAPPVIEPAASTDAPLPAASEPAKPKQNAATRVEELLADRAAERARADRLERELATLRQAPPVDVKPAVSSPAAVSTDPKPDHTDTTKYPDGQFDLKFQEDLGRWAGRQEYEAREAARQKADTDARQQADADQRVQAHETRVRAFAARCETALAANPDAAKDINPELFTFKPLAALAAGERPTYGTVIAEHALRSEHPYEFLRHLSNKAEADRLGALSPDEFRDELIRIDTRLGTPKAAPPPKTVTSAPNPPDTLGHRPGQAGDPLASAIANGDDRAYRRLRAEQRAAGRR